MARSHQAAIVALLAIITALWLTLKPRTLLHSSAICTGEGYSCAIKHDGSMWCWGSIEGNLGQKGHPPLAFPTAIPARGRWAQVSCGRQHVCSLKAGVAFCFGANAFGQLGDASEHSHSLPAPVATSGRWRQIVAGGKHSCGLKLDRRAWCWGRNNVGQLGDGTSRDHTVPHPVVGDWKWKYLSAGNAHTCGIRLDDTAWCWGNNTLAQLGDGTTITRLTPSNVIGDRSPNWAWITCGSHHTCGLTKNGSTWCWGPSVLGGHGHKQSWVQSITGGIPWDDLTLQPRKVLEYWNNVDFSEDVPFLVSPKIMDISSGMRETCAILQYSAVFKDAHLIFRAFRAGLLHWDYTTFAFTSIMMEYILCWGIDSEDVFADAPYIVNSGDSTITHGHTLSEVDVGSGHKCAMSSTGEARCWGEAIDGALGFGDITGHTKHPTPVAGMWIENEASVLLPLMIIIGALAAGGIVMRKNALRRSAARHGIPHPEADLGGRAEEVGVDTAVPLKAGTNESKHGEDPAESKDSSSEDENIHREINPLWHAPPPGQGQPFTLLAPQLAEVGVVNLQCAVKEGAAFFGKTMDVIRSEILVKLPTEVQRVSPENVALANHAAAAVAAAIGASAITLLVGTYFIAQGTVFNFWELGRIEFKHLGASINRAIYENIGINLSTIAGSLEGMREAIDNIGRQWQDMRQLEHTMALAIKFERKCNDMLMGGMAACAFFWIARVCMDGILANLIWKATDFCGAFPSTLWNPMNLIKFVGVLMCDVGMISCGIAILALTVLIPIAGFLLLQLKPILPEQFRDLVPSIKDNEFTFIIVGIGMFYGGLAAGCVNMLKGRWQLWWMLWGIWLLIFVSFFTFTEKIAPIAMRNYNLLFLILLMDIVFPYMMAAVTV